MAIARPLGRIVSIGLATIAVAYPANFFVEAWGEWRCGVNGINLVFVSAISAMVVMGCLALFRRCTPKEKRFSRWVLALPWLVYAALVLWFCALCPDCPFASR